MQTNFSLEPAAELSVCVRGARFAARWLRLSSGGGSARASPMSVGRKKIITACLLVALCSAGVCGKRLLCGPLRICGGSLTPQEVVQIKAIARKQIFTTRTNSLPVWLPVPIKECVCIPMLRLFSDATHPIDALQLVGSETVIVWYRGPEVKAYVKGKEVGWFERGLSVQKSSGEWKNCYPVWRFP